jgi:hypothetical protein
MFTELDRLETPEEVREPTPFRGAVLETDLLPAVVRVPEPERVTDPG